MKSFFALATVIAVASAARLIDEASGPCVLKDNVNAAMKFLSYLTDEKV